MKAIGLAAALAILLVMPAKAELKHCNVEDIGYADLDTLPAAQQIQWLTEELERCPWYNIRKGLIHMHRGSAYSELAQEQLAIDEFTLAIALISDADAVPNASDEDKVAASEWFLGHSTVYSKRSLSYCRVKPPRFSESLADMVKGTNLNRDEAIRIQGILSTKYYKGPIDGDFGPASQDAWLRLCVDIAAQN